MTVFEAKTSVIPAQAGIQNAPSYAEAAPGPVGWAERSEAQHCPHGLIVGLRLRLNPTYAGIRAFEGMTVLEAKTSVIPAQARIQNVPSYAEGAHDAVPLAP